MHITICCKQFVQRGGAETFLTNFARCLVDDGHRVRVIAPHVDAPLGDVEARRLRLPPVPRALRDLALAAASRRALAADDADVTFSDQKCWGADVVRPGGGVQREYVKQRAASYRTCLRRTTNRVLRALSIRERLRISIDDRLYAPPGPRLIIANSDMVRRELERHYPHVADRVRVVYNGADVQRFSPELKRTHRARVRAELGVPADALVGVFVGHDWRRKGLYTSIEALGLLTDGARPVHGIVVGRGNQRRAERAAARARCAERIRFVGPRSPEAFYGASDVLVLPSYYDPCANVTLEALACGLPAITSVHNGAFELLTPGVTGYCVDDASDAGQVAAYLERFRDPDRLAGASQAARELALRHPLKKMYRDIIGAIEELAARPRRRADRR